MNFGGQNSLGLDANLDLTFLKKLLFLNNYRSQELAKKNVQGGPGHACARVCLFLCNFITTVNLFSISNFSLRNAM